MNLLTKKWIVTLPSSYRINHIFLSTRWALLTRAYNLLHTHFVQITGFSHQITEFPGNSQFVFVNRCRWSLTFCLLGTIVSNTFYGQMFEDTYEIVGNPIPKPWTWFAAIAASTLSGTLSERFWSEFVVLQPKENLRDSVLILDEKILACSWQYN